MKTRGAGKRKDKIVWIAGGFLLVLFVLSFSHLKMKEAELRADKTITLSIDWLDLTIAAEREGQTFKTVIDAVDPALVQVIAVPVSLSSFQEELLRQKGFRLLWRWEQAPTLSVAPFLERLKKGDGVLSYGLVAAGYPRELNEVVAALKQVDGFYPIIEFAPQKGQRALGKAVFPRIVKGHCLQAKERLVEKGYLWGPRLRRAAQERWIRYYSIQFSPALTLTENMVFIRRTAEDLTQRGYDLGPPVPRPVWPSWNGPSASLARWAVLVLPLFIPVLLLFSTRSFSVSSPVLFFLMITLASTVAGTTLHAFGSTPLAVSGLVPAKGVKLQLLVPFLLGFLALTTSREWREALNTTLKGWHVAVAGVVLVLFAGGYLMRSGNFPLIPVLESERVFRDSLEAWFGARPRFKEFLIGHPLFILGLFVQSRESKGKNFFTDGRFFLALGVVGQISILNTFLHFHSPVQTGLIRTFHGAWLGVLFSVPLCYLWSKKK